MNQKQMKGTGQSTKDENLAYYRDKIQKLKKENRKLHNLLSETEEKFKSKLDQSRRDSENIQRVFNQILPALQNLILQNQFQNSSYDIEEAEKLIRFIENSSY